MNWSDAEKKEKRHQEDLDRLRSFRPMITTILCIGLLSIYALLGVTFLIHSIADIFDNRRRAKREEEREKRDLEYHEMRMKEFK